MLKEVDADTVRIVKFFVSKSVFPWLNLLLRGQSNCPGITVRTKHQQ